MPELKIRDLYVRYKDGGKANAVHNVNLTIGHGECIGIIGESGSGKSTLALSVMGLLEERAETGGSIMFDNRELLTMKEEEINTYRWRRIAIAFQNSLDVLNPVMTVGEQIVECIIRHTDMKKNDAFLRTKNLLEIVGLDSSWCEAYPHQLSGGMRQKVLISMSLSCDPDILIVDEPTMALDSVSKNEIVKLLLRLRKERKFSMVVISHEFPVIAALTSKVMVMYKGNGVEFGNTEDILKDPLHPYTRGLIYSSPSVYPYRDMWGIPGEIGVIGENQCPFYSRCNQRIEKCLHLNPVLRQTSEMLNRHVACLRGGIITLLRGENIHKKYMTGKKEVTACKDCTLEIKSGEVVALIGESGSGKTTLAEILSGIVYADRGKVYFENRQFKGNSETSKIAGIQIVFQDPFSATNEQLTIGEIIKEPLDVIKMGTKPERIEKVRGALKNVQLPYDDGFLKRKGHTLSGGQRQRVAIARALVMKPKLMIADEISSMLDPSNAANILRLLKGLQNTYGFSMLYITHDISLARKISDKVYVMRRGKIIEHGSAKKVFSSPENQYTKMLLEGSTALDIKIQD